MRSSGSASKGNQLKCWEDGYFIKLDSPNWYESISEVLVSELQSAIVNALPFVDYEWLEYKGYPACRSKNFLSEGESMVSLYSILNGTGYNIDYSGGGSYLRDTICGILNMEFNIKVYDYLAYMIYLDAIVLNEDRHLRNISFIQKSNKLRLCPIYDFGLSLLSDTNSYPLNKEIVDLEKIVEAQPFCKSFVDQTKLFDNPGIKIDVNRLFGRLDKALANPSQCVSLSYEKYLVRAISVLKDRLISTEGELWTRA